MQDPMDDPLVPIIPHDKLEEVATEFLRNNFPAALQIPAIGQAPVWVDPTVLAENMGLTIKSKRIREDATVFGQIYFDDTNTEMYDEKSESNVSAHIKGRTIVVDPKMYLLRNLGSVNNTIIHECVH